jgi:peptidyl-prolyl cis-trans isomerase C
MRLRFEFSFRRLAATLAAPALISLSGLAYGQTLASVDGHALTLAQIVAANPAAAGDTALRARVLDELVQQQLLADTVAQVPVELRTRVDAAGVNVRRQLLAQYAARQFLDSVQPDQAALRKAYDAEVKKLPSTQYCVRWIVVADPAQAGTLLDALRGGASFAEVALQHSIAQNAELGGAMGWQSATTLPAPVLGVVRGLHAREIAGPIAFDSGYAIVQLLATRATPKPSFEQVRAQLEQQQRNMALQQHLTQLRKQAKITEAPAAAAH